MSQSPKVSIVMPVRNEATYLPAALNSLLRQTLTSWELIAVDDGSSDATPSILANAALKDRRINVLRQDSLGLVAALNSGLHACKAPLVARMDGDDICHPRRLELQVDYLDKHPLVGLVACNFRHFPRTFLKQGMLLYENWQNQLDCQESILRDRFIESPFVHPSIVTRRETMTAVGGYRDMGWPEDYDLWLRMADQGVRFARLPDQLFFWRDHPERATRVMHEYAVAAFRACKLSHLKQGFLKDTHEIVIAGAGLEGRAWQRLLLAAGIKVAAWIDVDQRRIGTLLHGAPVRGIHEIPELQSKILVAIGVRGAREQFRELVEPQGLKEGLDFICIA